MLLSQQLKAILSQWWHSDDCMLTNHPCHAARLLTIQLASTGSEICFWTCADCPAKIQWSICTSPSAAVPPKWCCGDSQQGKAITLPARVHKMVQLINIHFPCPYPIERNIFPVSSDVFTGPASYGKCPVEPEQMSKLEQLLWVSLGLVASAPVAGCWVIMDEWPYPHHIITVRKLILPFHHGRVNEPLVSPSPLQASHLLNRLK